MEPSLSGPTRPFALLAVAALVTAPAAALAPQTCPDATLARNASAGAPGPRLRTPEGPPIPGRPFSMEVDLGAPGHAGLLVVGTGAVSFTWPKYGAVFYPTGVLATEVFLLDGEGVSPELLSVGAFDPSLCGAQAAAQAFVLDGSAQGGVAFSNAVRLRVGEVQSASFAGLATNVGIVTDHIAVGDLNGDGIPDVVASDRDLGRVATSLGNGDGTFDALSPIVTALGAGALAVEDFDGDGFGDVVMTNDRATFNQLYVFRGLGDGTLAAPVVYGGGTDPVAIEAGDVDGDGRLDLVVANGTSDDVSVHLGSGVVEFDPALLFPAGESPSDLVLADLNGDDDLDVAVAIYGGLTPGVAVLLGAGDGTFGAPLFAATPGRPNAVDVADLDGDTVPDLFVSQTGPLLGEGRLSTLIGNGDGTFAVAWTEPFAPVGNGRLVDLDDDGDLDYVATTALAFQTAHGNGDGTFGAAVTYPTGRNFRELRLADVNDDGQEDVVAGLSTGGVFTVHLGYEGTFPGLTLVPALQDPLDVLFTDMNGDRSPDLVVSNFTSTQVSIYAGDGEGGFAFVSSEIGGDAVRDIFAADLNADGKQDLAVPNGFGVGVLLGNGDGTIEPQTSYHVGSNPVSLAGGDLTGDQVVDLVAARYSLGDVGVLVGVGDGTFLPVQYVTMGPAPYQVELALLDGDSELDLLALDTTENELYVRLGKGDGTFGERNAYPAGSGVESFDLGDVDGDGHLDAVVTSYDEEAVRVLPGNGLGGFGASTAFPSGPNPVSVRLGDFDEDGELDVVVVNRRFLTLAEGGTVALLAGAGDGTFGPPAYFTADQSAEALVAGDVDLDGSLDLAIANSGPTYPVSAPGSVTLLLNRIGE